jgi:osmotically inducible protein OsmC
MPVRSADARWEGALQSGKGTMRLAGGAYEGPYSFSSRFEDGSGTNPEELIAAAHAGCFSMAFAAGLGGAGYEPVSVQTTAKLQFDKGDQGWRVTRIDLVTEAEVPGIDEAEFQERAEAAKKGCPVSVLLSSVDIGLEAKLIS